MSQLHRQALQASRRLAAERRAERAPAVGDGPRPHAEHLRSGVAKVLSYDDEEGLYTITEQWWNGQEEQYEDAVSPLGLVEAQARDYANCRFGSAGQLVRFWQQRAQQAAVETLIDVSGGWDGVERISSFCVHYSGIDETTEAFHVVPQCKFCHIEIDVVVRQCVHTEPREHPGHKTMDYGGFADGGWSLNLFWSWQGGDWAHVIYRWHDTAGNTNCGWAALADFYIDCRVEPNGGLEFRVRNERTGEANTVHAIIAGRVRIVPHPLPPGTLEFGNCCCHFEEDD